MLDNKVSYQLMFIQIHLFMVWAKLIRIFFPVVTNKIDSLNSIPYYELTPDLQTGCTWYHVWQLEGDNINATSHTTIRWSPQRSQKKWLRALLFLRLIFTVSNHLHNELKMNKYWFNSVPIALLQIVENYSSLTIVIWFYLCTFSWLRHSQS